ncbi:MAG: hypothetical protein JST55_05815 [Bacteroidetes bacterium]|nr:hypothetical protein [Bacteroidota bacterium]
MKTSSEIKNKIRITAKKASILAMKELKSFPKYSDVKNLLLEEVELSRDRLFWNVTLSFDPFLPTKQGALGLTDVMKVLGTKIQDIKYNPHRIFKIFKVNTQTGEVESMKTRKIA